MKCPKCQYENQQNVKFCVNCGNNFGIICVKCGSISSSEFNFCGECGHDLSESTETTPPKVSGYTSHDLKIPHEEIVPTKIAVEGERKHVTVLFSDLTGYTALSEKLDPEEVKEITSQIYSKISKIIGQYDGFIEKYVGDAVMAIFGVPKAHEDDPVRAVKAATEIHKLVESISPDVEGKIGQPISMHTGINTGLVVTGYVDIERGTHGIAGDTINLASRLSNLAEPGEILVNVDTCRQIEGYYTCEIIDPVNVKGKSEPVQVHRVLSQRDIPVTVRRISGVRANLVGRSVEMAELSEAIRHLDEGRGSIFSIVGGAGTGKSRLIDDFKTTLDLGKIQWLEGHAYPYTQNMPYFPMIDLLNRAFHIKEGDQPETVREKIETEIRILIDNHSDVIPYVGGLYSLDYPEIEEVSPEFWKSRLQVAISSVLIALAKRARTVFVLEDLHWADPSFVELLRRAYSEIRQPAIILCIYRPNFNLIKSHQVNTIGKIHHEMRLQDLSRSESQEMIQSLLKTENIPRELLRFLQDKMEGNPFYLEEAINSLIDSSTLVRDNGEWRVTKHINETDISSTIQGVISARVDRLEQESKRVLQEASVIGRSFYYEILKRTTALSISIDESLYGLEHRDLIKTKSIQPELEYIFKHALTQEVVYNGLLKKDRREIHERIANVIENLFKDRLVEFYETLSFHFSKGLSLKKAISYLMKSANKSLTRYSIEESNQYYKHALELLESTEIKTDEERELLVDLLIGWAYVLYYRGYFKEMAEIFSAKIKIAESIKDKTKLGMFYAWYGWALYNQNKVSDSYPWFKKALLIGEEAKDQHLIGYACTWLTWYYLTVCRIDQSIKHGERTQEISKDIESDPYLYFKSLGGLGLAYCASGDKIKTIDIGNKLINYGNKHSNIRSLTLGYNVLGAAYSYDNDITTAIKFYEKAIQVTAEPFYIEFIRFNLVLAYIVNDQITEAENAIDSIVAFCQESGAWGAGEPAQVYYGAIMIAKGKMAPGLKQLENGKQKLAKNGNMLCSLICDYIIANVFSQIAARSAPINLSIIVKNIGFLVKNVPFASKKAEKLYKEVIAAAEEMGIIPIVGGACLDLGLLYKVLKRRELAKKYMSKASELFKQCGYEVYLKQANDAIESLK